MRPTSKTLPALSIEAFPPKTETGMAALNRALDELSVLPLDFISVTYGAGGSTRDRTLQVLSEASERHDAPLAGHLTCVEAPRADVDAVARAYKAAGVDHVVALRGDPSAGVGERYVPTAEGYEQTADLVRGLKQLGIRRVSVSAYPEKHPESSSLDEDMDILAAKVDAGADEAITQYFFDTACFLRYRDRAAARGIAVPIVAGIMPINDFRKVQRFSRQCHTEVPASLAARFAGFEGGSAQHHAISRDILRGQIEGLLSEGVETLHLYALNKSDLILDVARDLGWIAEPSIEAA
ncbi:MAG: methylenetetrahydrofolate reductase [Pseudomonadota bacterium]